MHGTDPRYLLTQQYRDASNLNARRQLHERFSTNPYGWHRWVFDRLELPPGARILELGCGPGALWLENRAATNGCAHMRELHAMVRSAARVTGQAAAIEWAAPAASWTEPFNLENGQAELSAWFSTVALHRYLDALLVTEVEPLAAYVLSGRNAQVLTEDVRAAFTQLVGQEIGEQSAFRITKDSGLFVALRV